MKRQYLIASIISILVSSLALLAADSSKILRLIDDAQRDYRTAMASAKGTYDLQARRAFDIYLKRLKGLEKQVTQTGDLDAALGVRAEIKRVEGKPHDSALVADLGVADDCGGLGQRRSPGLDDLRGLDLVVGGGGADGDSAAVFFDIVELGQTADIDERAR